jgi:hypothetical protein
MQANKDQNDNRDENDKPHYSSHGCRRHDGVRFTRAVHFSTPAEIRQKSRSWLIVNILETGRGLLEIRQFEVCNGE